MDGKIDAAGGHAAGWAAKEQHGYSASANGVASCKTCHGADLADCTTCHTAAGFAGWRTDCTFCHGTAGLRASPPVDTAGQTVRTNVSVGAHEKHATTAMATSIGCSACHVVPGDVATDAAHMDGGNAAEVALSGVSNGTYTRTSATAATCSTYCHGTFPGGNNQPVSWVSTTALTCTSCHGSPPAAPHVQRTDCGTCHTGYSSSTVVAASHVNGSVQHVAMTCTSCHGKVGQSATPASPLNAAPPTDTTLAATGARVGAHQKHLTGGTYSNAFACTTCHQSVGAYAQTHANGTRDVGFGGAANTNLRKGTFVAGTPGSCSATWCHGAVISRTGGTVGGTLTAPAWTASVTACTACHAVTGSGLGGNHNRSDHRVACTTCHGTGYGSTGSPPTGNGVNLGTHVDGVKTIVTVASGTGIRTWNPTTRTCTASCHGSETW